MDIAAADLPSDKLDLLTKRLLAEQERRINENRLGHYPIRSRLSFMLRVPLTVSAC